MNKYEFLKFAIDNRKELVEAGVDTRIIDSTVKDIFKSAAAEFAGGQQKIDFRNDNNKSSEKKEVVASDESSTAGSGNTTDGERTESSAKNKVKPSTTLKEGDKVVISNKATLKVEHAGTGTSTIAVDTKIAEIDTTDHPVGEVKGEESASTSQEDTASEKSAEEEVSTSQEPAKKEEAVVTAETDIKAEAKKAEKAVIERAATSEEAYDRVKVLVNEKLDQNLHANNGRARLEVIDFIRDVFPSSEVYSENNKNGKRQRNKLVDVIFKECATERNKQNIAEVAPETKTTPVAETTAPVEKEETTAPVAETKPEEKAEEKVDDTKAASILAEAKEAVKVETAPAAEVKAEEKKPVIGPAIIPANTKIITADEIRVALEIASPDEMVEKDLPSKEDLKLAIVISFESLDEHAVLDAANGKGDLFQKWMSHITARKDSVGEELNKTIQVQDKTNPKGIKEVNKASFFLSKVAEGVYKKIVNSAKAA